MWFWVQWAVSGRVRGEPAEEGGLSQEARVLFPPPLHTLTYTLAPFTLLPAVAQAPEGSYQCPREVLPSNPPLPQSRQQVLKQPFQEAGLPAPAVPPLLSRELVSQAARSRCPPTGTAFGASVCVFCLRF